MFVDFLAEKYGERPLWSTVASQAKAFTGWFFPGTFKSGFGVGFSELFDQFAQWVNVKFPVRAKPPNMRTLQVLGNDARYARGRDGTEAWIAIDVDAPARLTIRDPRGEVLLDETLVEIFPRGVGHGHRSRRDVHGSAHASLATRRRRALRSAQQSRSRRVDRSDGRDLLLRVRRR
jgi:hypothetical protein